MITELLEKFEDLFQPHDEETVRERMPEWVVTFSVISDRYRSNYLIVKRMVVKAPEYRDRIAINVAVEELGLKGSAVRRSTHMTRQPHTNYIIQIGKEDNVVDDAGDLMIGTYKITAQSKFEGGGYE